ncbi:hypothetical protein [Sedimenticola sp.]|uniref:hypothetical protein n=1 Tax=Sedimenticola sp. TaxID=1940285 RepID=UPI003D0A4FE9
MKNLKYLVVVSALLASGCSTVAPHYQASFENTQKLKNNDSSQVTVSQFQAADDKVNHLTIRGGNFASPTNGSYVEYLKKALEQELYDANRLADDSDVKVGGTLLENEIDASGFSVGVAHVKAEFTVKDKEKTRYQKVHSADIQWPSNFVGAIAIPRAVQEYPRVFSELLGKLYADPDFMNALK